MKILTVDAGNSQLVLVAYENGNRVAGRRLWTHPLPEANDLHDALGGMLSELGWKAQELCLSISSVVPKLNQRLGETCEKLSPRHSHWVSWQSIHPFAASESAAREIGADLIAGLMGARELGKPPLVVVDCGTATKLTLLDQHDRIMGVAILPGLEVQLKSIAQSAPHLPKEVSLEPPPMPFGNDTPEALQSGILYGHAAVVEGMVARYRALFPQQRLTAFGCGGLFNRIARLCPSIDIEEMELVNIGCRLLAALQVQERF